MVVALGSNIASLRGQSQLNKTSKALGTVYERLSSGQRINRASDDAAGLAIANSLNANGKVYSQAVRNLGDGISLLNIADAAIENLSSIVLRLQELTEQAASGTYGTTQRKALDSEAQALSKEFLRIVQVTEFNGRSLFSGSDPLIHLQAGFGSAAVVTAGVGGAIGSGSFGGSTEMLTDDTYTNRQVALGDLNGDGILDMATSGYNTSGDQFTNIRLGTGSGSFGAITSYSAIPSSGWGLALGDINNDGHLDIVTDGTSQLGVGNGTFGAAYTYFSPYVGANDVALGDLNSDGFLDMVLGGSNGTAYSFVKLGVGNGTFGAATSYSSTGLTVNGLTLADLNRDSILDLVTASYGGDVEVRFGAGNGTFGSATNYANAGYNFESMKLGDLNGDGHLDIVTAGRNSGVGKATVRLNSGNGTFGSATSYNTDGSSSRDLTLGDLNGDGFLDLVTSGITSSNGSAVIRLGAGNGTFGAAVSYDTGQEFVTYGVELGDISGDGVLDLITTGYEDGNIGSTSIRIADTRSGVSPLLPFSLRTMSDARQAMPIFERKRDQLAAQRGQIGAFQSKIQVASNVLQVTGENFKAAESRIRDADTAEESSNLVRLNILQQAASAVLAQANQQPSLALSLLQQ